MTEIKSIDGEVLYSSKHDNIRAAVVEAVAKNADLSRANLSRAYLSRAYLSEADLREADLREADLSGADLRGADLRRANISGVRNVISCGLPDGWHAFGWHKGTILMVQVGCRSFTLDEGRQYWVGKTDRREVLAALDYIQAVAKIRGWDKE